MAQKTNSINMFQIGDRVMYVGDSEKPNLHNNPGTITELSKKNGQEYDQVRFDNPLDSDGEYNYHCYFCFAKNLKKISSGGESKQ